MTLALVPALDRSENDDDWLMSAFRRPGGIADLPECDQSRLSRRISALGIAPLIELAAQLEPAEAAALYKIWLGLHVAAPEACVAWFNLGVALAGSGEPAEAAVAYETALLLKPELHEAAINLGFAREALGRGDEALRVWRRALPGAEARRLLHTQIGRRLEIEGRLEEAAAELRAALLIDPDQPDVQQHWVHMRQRMAIWPAIASDVPGLTEDALERNCGPLAGMALFDDPGRQRDIAAAWILRKLPPAPLALAPRGGYAHARLRIGYLSSDFCRHPVAFQFVEILERHDRSAFEVFGYCASPEDGSELRARALAAFDRFTPIGALDDETAARRIRADEIDVLVDLNGLTKGSRLSVLRWRPAPVQATYLGFIGSVPLPELDWMICDETAIPPDLADQYAPRPLALPGCYQANDSRPPELAPVSRAEEDLPEGAFVFCCFSHHYKITEPVFEAWLAIMEQAPHAVLWLIDDGAVSRANLTRRWLARGLAAERLIFAARVEPARYRARMALADLFLDTTPYNAGTVASDALRVGLPILTIAGRAFAARMGTSLLTAVGLPEGIAADLADYVARAVAVANDPARCDAMKRRLAGDAWMRTLGASEAFTRRLEDAYRRIHVGAPSPDAPSP